MGILENAITKTKDILEIARVKTDEVVTIEKRKFKVASLKTKREKDFAKLGKIYFNIIKNQDELDDDVTALVNNIIEKTEEISRLNAEIQVIKSRRVCTNCGSGVEESASYCNNCGVKLG